jgi:hypothetical protein
VRKLKGETHLHAAARATMIGWLRRAAERAGYDKDATFGPISWRVNRRGPKWGVFEEYPLIEYMCRGHVPAWDEYATWPTDAPNITMQDIVPTPGALCRLPTLNELSRAGVPPLAVVDIAIQHKGMISDVVEIVYKSDLSEKKITLLSDRARLRVWRADAEWVVKHVDEPQEFPYKGFRLEVPSKIDMEEVY